MIVLTSYNEKNLQATLYIFKYINVKIFKANITKKTLQKGSRNSSGISKLNLKLYAKKRVNKDNIVSSDIKNSNLFLAVGFNTQFPF